MVVGAALERQNKAAYTEERSCLRACGAEIAAHFGPKRCFYAAVLPGKHLSIIKPKAKSRLLSERKKTSTVLTERSNIHIETRRLCCCDALSASLTIVFVYAVTLRVQKNTAFICMHDNCTIILCTIYHSREQKPLVCLKQRYSLKNISILKVAKKDLFPSCQFTRLRQFSCGATANLRSFALVN